ncbi:DUF1295 domain-containing protein [Kangiella japonica]|uniref:DUF1295 domain-containing protein n=1 Tax=Kangiella japonica TaxID=647384 RepID=A0ABN0SYD8_9GAMM
MPNINLLLALLCLNLIAQITAWFWQKKYQHADIVDIVWAGMIVVNGLILFFLATGDWFYRFVVLVIPVAWYFRLFWHLISRYDLSKEDGRYAHLRSYWKENTQLKFLFFFVGQGLIISLFSFPASVLANHQGAIGVAQLAALLIITVSYIGVWLSDRQLHQFKRNAASSGKVCDHGLWKYSRHPNYFFEWTHWFAYPLLLIGSELVWLMIVFPFIMLLFLLKLTGIPFNEQQNLRSKGEAYRQYQERTNKFFIGPPQS